MTLERHPAGASSLPDDGAHNIAFLDIGTNSMRLLVVRLDPVGSFSVLTQQKESIRLGEGEFATDELQQDAMDRAVLVGKRFVEMATSFDVARIVAVATSATREATNQREFVERLRDDGGLDVRVISGREEARLIYLGVASGARLGDDSALFIDVGGGSTELIVGDRLTHHYLDTLRLGAIRLANLFFLPDDPNPVDPERYELVRRFVRSHVVRSVQSLKQYRPDVAIGSSGTIVTLGEIAARRFLERPLEKHDSFTHAQIREVIDNLAGLALEDRLKVPGMSANRGDILIPGGAIFDVLMEELGIETITVSDRTLRDGLLIDLLSRTEAGAEMEGLSFRAQSVLRLAKRCRVDLDHTRHVTHLALDMFDSSRTSGLHTMGDWERELLEYAGMLHDVGTFLTYTNHRQHSYYFIRNAELLGFDETEVSIIATTTMFHKKTYPRKKHQEYASLDKRSQKIVRMLCTILRIAESLDRSHTRVVSRAGFETVDDDRAVLELIAGGECELELWGVQAHDKAFRRTFGRALEVTTRVEMPQDAPEPS